MKCALGREILAILLLLCVGQSIQQGDSSLCGTGGNLLCGVTCYRDGCLGGGGCDSDGKCVCDCPDATCFVNELICALSCQSAGNLDGSCNKDGRCECMPACEHVPEIPDMPSPTTTTTLNPTPLMMGILDQSEPTTTTTLNPTPLVMGISEVAHQSEAIPMPAKTPQVTNEPETTPEPSQIPEPTIEPQLKVADESQQATPMPTKASHEPEATPVPTELPEAISTPAKTSEAEEKSEKLEYQLGRLGFDLPDGYRAKLEKELEKYWFGFGPYGRQYREAQNKGIEMVRRHPDKQRTRKRSSRKMPRRNRRLIPPSGHH